MRVQRSEDSYRFVRETLVPAFSELAACSSTVELHAHPTYLRLKPDIDRALQTPDMGDYRNRPAPPQNRYRVVAWNIERGIQLDGQIEALRTHSYLREADVLLLTETDVGMARSGNRAVAQEIAQALGMCYAFVPCYLNLAKGAGIEHRFDGNNELGLHGNAILSRYPLRNVRGIPLANGRDKMAGREKRIGHQHAVAAEVDLPHLRFTAIAVHLDAQSSQQHRNRQMCDVLAGVGPGAAVLGGDWNTSTYNSSRALHAILGFWLRVLMGADNVIRNHYLHPYARFEKELFASLERHGFNYRRANVAGERTAWYSVTDRRARENLGEWVPWWCFPFMRWALRKHGGECPLKLDWFAVRGVHFENPAVLHEVREGRDIPLSDHDAIAIDILPQHSRSCR
jgi:endonuclease/exonuclease/phosphatase family metal-dependent hydrolase